MALLTEALVVLVVSGVAGWLLGDVAHDNFRHHENPAPVNQLKRLEHLFMLMLIAADRGDDEFLRDHYAEWRTLSESLDVYPVGIFPVLDAEWRNHHATTY